MYSSRQKSQMHGYAGESNKRLQSSESEKTNHSLEFTHLLLLLYALDHLPNWDDWKKITSLTWQVKEAHKGGVTSVAGCGETSFASVGHDGFVLVHGSWARSWIQGASDQARWVLSLPIGKATRLIPTLSLWTQFAMKVPFCWGKQNCFERKGAAMMDDGVHS